MPEEKPAPMGREWLTGDMVRPSDPNLNEKAQVHHRPDPTTDCPVVHIIVPEPQAPPAAPSAAQGQPVATAQPATAVPPPATPAREAE